METTKSKAMHKDPENADEHKVNDYKEVLDKYGNITLTEAEFLHLADGVSQVIMAEPNPILGPASTLDAVVEFAQTIKVSPVELDKTISLFMKEKEQGRNCLSWHIKSKAKDLEEKLRSIRSKIDVGCYSSAVRMALPKELQYETVYTDGYPGVRVSCIIPELDFETQIPKSKKYMQIDVCGREFRKKSNGYYGDDHLFSIRIGDQGIIRRMFNKIIGRKEPKDMITIAGKPVGQFLLQLYGSNEFEPKTVQLVSYALGCLGDAVLQNYLNSIEQLGKIDIKVDGQ